MSSLWEVNLLTIILTLNESRTQDGTWGDATMVMAASLLYKRQICVYSDESKTVK